jgi:putative transposase
VQKVLGHYTSECLVTDFAGCIRSNRAIEVLLQLISMRGAPQTVRQHNGLAFVSRVLKNDIGMTLIGPGKPRQVGTSVSFNGKFRDKGISMEWFRVRQEAKTVIDSGREHYNQVRPHLGITNMTPIAFIQKCISTIKAGAIV